MMPGLTLVRSSWTIYFLTRLVFHVLHPLDWTNAYVRWQHLDLAALKSDYWISLFNCHMQPPLFNALLGAFVKIVPECYCEAAARIIYIGLGALSFMAFRGLLSETIKHEGIRRFFEIAYVIMPPILFAERWLGYTLPVMCCLTWMAYALSRWMKCGLRRYWYCYLVLGMSIVLMRSLYHALVWFVPCTFLALFAKGKKRVVIGAVEICLFIVLALLPNVFNFARYGMFASSTWQGMNLMRTLEYVTVKDRQDLIAAGRCSSIASIAPFSCPEVYLDYYGIKNDPTPSTPSVLACTHKAAYIGEQEKCPNYNHYIIPQASREYQASWKELVCAYPAKYLYGVLNAVYSFFSWEMYHYWHNACEWLPSRMDSSVSRMVKGIKSFVVPALMIAIYTIAVLGWGKNLLHFGDKWILCAFCLLTCHYTFVVSVFAELGENNLMRVPIDPLLLAGVAFYADFIMAKSKVCACRK